MPAANVPIDARRSDSCSFIWERSRSEQPHRTRRAETGDRERVEENDIAGGRVEPESLGRIPGRCGAVDDGIQGDHSSGRVWIDKAETVSWGYAKGPQNPAEARLTTEDQSSEYVDYRGVYEPPR